VVVPLKLDRYWRDFDGALEKISLSLATPGFTAAPAAIDAKQTQTSIRLTIKPGTPPGEYSLVFQGKGRMPFLREWTNPKAARSLIDVSLPSPPLSIRVVAAPVHPTGGSN
jgi:hypothetical protein